MTERKLKHSFRGIFEAGCSYSDDNTFFLHSVSIIGDRSSVQVGIPGGGVEVGIDNDGRSLRSKYTLAQFHFHWGSEDSFGSEHSIDNNFYAMEVVTIATAYSVSMAFDRRRSSNRARNRASMTSSDRMLTRRR